ncbi:hypothetical protein Hdeb2414_s0018g00537751 [Helianthus debilis subsp. tardiflorus]
MVRFGWSGVGFGCGERVSQKDIFEGLVWNLSVLTISDLSLPTSGAPADYHHHHHWHGHLKIQTRYYEIEEIGSHGSGLHCLYCFYSSSSKNIVFILYCMFFLLPHKL